MSPSALSKPRFWGTLAFVGALFLIVAYQLFQLTIFRRAALLDLADKQHLLQIDEPALRGQILDRNGKEIATNL